MSEFERLGARLPDEIQQLISEYAQPVYKKPYHFRYVSELFNNLKEYSISWILYNNDELVYNDETDERVKILRKKQLGAICEEEDMDVTVTGFIDYLIIKDVLYPNLWLNAE
tara:strand:+ start:135 stop:470 length:336 start_codon:yes stop_codon:yes gene_type:complete